MRATMLPTPSDGPVRLGAKLRASRQFQGFTIDDLAAATGLSKGFISKIERDETSPSVTTLVALCQVLSLPVGSLFEEPANQVVELPDAAEINLGGRGLVERMLTPRAEPKVQVLRSVLAPGAAGAELSTVNCDVEVIHVLEGELVVRFATQSVRLRATDTVTLSGREPNAWDNPGDAETTVISVLVPAVWSGSA